jgi:hypothetical protein
LRGIHGAGEISDEAIARCIEDPASVRGDKGIDDGSVPVESAERADLISLHEAAIAFDIGCEDRGKLSFDGARFQGFGTSQVEYSPIRRKSPKACKRF